MLELLVALELILLSRTTIGDIISVSSLAKGLISRIGEKDAFCILKKAIDKTAVEAEEAEIKEILDGLKGKEELLHEFRVVNEEAKRELVSKYFKGRSDVLEQLAKNYYELFCKEATKKDRPFREFVVIELGKLANQGVITNEAVKTVERHLEGIIEEIKREKEAASRQFIITDDLNAVGSEILAGKPPIEYVERKELEKAKGALENTNKLLVVGKQGAGKSRFLLRILAAFNGYDRFVVIRSFFREGGISSLDAKLQELDSFILIWDDLHRVKKELVNQTINQIEQLAKEYGKDYLFIGASRMEGEYYQFKQEEIRLDDFRSLELIEKCSAYFGVSVDGGVKKELLEVGDGTPFYVISLFATSKERGKKRLTEDDLKALLNDSFELWRDHLNFLESEGRLSTSEKNLLRSIALAMMAVPAIDIEVLEKFYAQIFRGNLSEFDYALDEVVKKFFIGMGGELCSMHAVQAAVVDEKYPVEERKIDRLKEVITALERDKCLILLWAFAHWFHASKKYGDCLKFLDLFIEQEPNIAEAYNNRGNAYNGLSEHERAIEDYNKAIALNPNFAGAYNNRGVAYVRLKQHEQAIGDYDKAIALNPSYVEAYSNRGAAYYGLKQHEQAIGDYDKAIVLNPNYAEAYSNRGNTYAELNQRERAIEDYNKAIALNPNYAGAYSNRGNTYAELNQRERAIEDYNKAIALNPNYAEAYSNRGNTYAELNQRERAIEDYNKAIALNPNDAEAYSNRGNTYAELNQHERAIKDYNKATALNPNDAKTYYNRGAAYYGLNQHEQAIENYNKAVELNPNDAEAYNNRGAAYYGLNQHEQAIEDYNNAIALNPNFADAYGNRGIAHSEIGRYEESARDLKKAGILFFDSGSEEDTVKTFSFCFDLRPKIENEDVIYSGLALFLITLNPDVIIELKQLRIEDETLRKIFELTLMKLRDEDISEGIAMLEEKEQTREKKILFGLLKTL
uniref:Photosystem I assembly protein Ycf3 n=1 Tax=Candidatus Methanophaga sp. ANME-1 ERB7 TaxID=2759913 RepID=A0A7G9Z5B0_9EURY|nr:photosystem I assembly protein Ycf3 [Methanosarcinales archaeon ANME-1 ERB7]